MTNEKAIDLLDNLIGMVDDNQESDYDTALKMGKQALSQEPCEDAISREELLKAIDTWDKFGYTETGCFVREPKGDYVPYIHYDDVIKCIKGMPSVTQKSGKWIRVTDKTGRLVWECDKCSWQQRFNTNFCPDCGAKMVEPQESEEDACKNCYYNDGEVHAECVICDKAESEEQTE